MEAVKVFNSELAGLYECKPPISKAKMTAITKAAIRAIKFYKHVVQSVEKFIQKCKTEYKIPGLYVIDSIVRQSRHQFSVEKDVFAPRFAKNITVTFFYLFKCPQEDKSKVIRVLNLWQKNHVFGEDVIQPLFDLADPNHPIQKEVANLISMKANKAKAATQPQQQHPHTPQQHTPQYQNTPQQQQPQTPQHTPQQNSHQPTSTTPSTNIVTPATVVTVSLANQDSTTTASSVVSSLDPALIQQIQQILMKTEDGPVASAVAALGLQQHSHALPALSQSHPIPPPTVSVATQITTAAGPPPQVIPSMQDGKPGLIHPRISQPTGDFDGRSLPFLPVDTSQPPPGYNHQGFTNINTATSQHPQPLGVPPGLPTGLPSALPNTGLPAGVTSGHSAGPPLPPPSGHSGANAAAASASVAPIPSPCHPAGPPSAPPPGHHGPPTGPPGQPNNIPPPLIDFTPTEIDLTQSKSPREEGEHSDDDSEDNKENHDDRDLDSRRRRRSSRSRSVSRSKRSNRRRSRSRSTSRTRHHRSRSRSRSRSRRSRSRDRDRDRRERDRERGRREREKLNFEREQEREREKERKKRGLPPIKKEHLSICSTTVWVGHLSKLVHQEELSDTFGEYGDIISIDLIPPRGCAFICMNRRQDAARALAKLKNHKMHNKAITLAWAPGKGVKGKEFKDYWEVEVGCSYIPYSKLSQMSNLDLDAIEEGGMIDEDTVPSWLKGRIGVAHPPAPNIPPIVASSAGPPPHSNIVNMGLPLPSNPLPDGRGPPPPPIPTLPPPLNKDVRRERPHLPPPPMMPPFAMPNIPPPGVAPGGMPIGAPLMPPNLPPPIGVPPPIGMPPINLPPSSSLLNQPPLLGVPPHVSLSHTVQPPHIVPVTTTTVSNNTSQDSDNMDVEMEDVEKPEPHVITTQIHSPPPHENVRPQDRIASSSKGHDGERETEEKERMDVERNIEERDPSNSPISVNKVPDPFHPQGEVRADGFSPFAIGEMSGRPHNFGPTPTPAPAPTPAPTPGPAPVGPLGIIPRNRPNFGPRGIHSFNPPRGVLPHPPLLGGRPNILSDIGGANGGPRGIGPGMGSPRPLGLRPGGPIGGIMGGSGGLIQGPRGLPAPPGCENRFGGPPGGFPRFGIIGGPRPLAPHTSAGDKGGDWLENSRGGGFLGVRPVERYEGDTWPPKVEDMFPRMNRLPNDDGPQRMGDQERYPLMNRGPENEEPQRMKEPERFPLLGRAPDEKGGPPRRMKEPDMFPLHARGPVENPPHRLGDMEPFPPGNRVGIKDEVHQMKEPDQYPHMKRVMNEEHSHRMKESEMFSGHSRGGPVDDHPQRMREKLYNNPMGDIPQNDPGIDDAKDHMNGALRHKNEDKERMRDRDRDRDKFRDRDRDRNKERENEWDRWRSRDRDSSRYRGGGGSGGGSERYGREDRDRERSYERREDRDRYERRDDKTRERPYDRKDRDRERSYERREDRDRERRDDGRDRDRPYEKRDDRDRDRSYEKREDRESERSYERNSRWGGGSSDWKDEKRPREEERVDGNSESFADDGMTWDSWATFANMSLPPPPPVPKRGKADDFPSRGPKDTYKPINSQSGYKISIKDQLSAIISRDSSKRVSAESSEKVSDDPKVSTTNDDKTATKDADRTSIDEPELPKNDSDMVGSISDTIKEPSETDTSTVEVQGSEEKVSDSEKAENQINNAENTSTNIECSLSDTGNVDKISENKSPEGEERDNGDSGEKDFETQSESPNISDSHAHTETQSDSPNISHSHAHTGLGDSDEKMDPDLSSFSSQSLKENEVIDKVPSSEIGMEASSERLGFINEENPISEVEDVSNSVPEPVAEDTRISSDLLESSSTIDNEERESEEAVCSTLDSERNLQTSPMEDHFESTSQEPQSTDVDFEEPQMKENLQPEENERSFEGEENSDIVQSENSINELENRSESTTTNFTENCPSSNEKIDQGEFECSFSSNYESEKFENTEDTMYENEPQLNSESESKLERDSSSPVKEMNSLENENNSDDNCTTDRDDSQTLTLEQTVKETESSVHSERDAIEQECSES